MIRVLAIVLLLPVIGYLSICLRRGVAPNPLIMGLVLASWLLNLF